MAHSDLRLHLPFPVIVSDDGRVETRAPLDQTPVRTHIDPALLERLRHLGFLRNMHETSVTGGGDPVFVLGCHRSGTTLMRYLFEAHPKFACPPETKFVSALVPYLQQPQVYASLEGAGLSPDEIYAHLRRFVSGIMDEYAARKGKPRWADKTPNHYVALEFIDRMFAQTARYVVIVRHPLDCVSSLETTLHFEQFARSDAQITAALERHGTGRYGFARYWCEVNDRIDVFRRGCPERTHLVRYEDLVRAPLQCMRQVFAFLGEDCPDSLEQDAFSSPHGGPGEDPLAHKTRRVERDRVGRYKKWSAAERDALWRVVERTARGFDYTP